MAKSSFRNARKNKFTQISNEMLNDSNLSLEAKGLLAIFLSNSEDWKISMPEIIRRSKNGRDKHYNVIKELVENGYFGRIEVRENGRFKELIYLFSDNKQDVIVELEFYEKDGTNIDAEPLEPVTENQETEADLPVTENPDAVNSKPESQYINNTNSNNTKYKNTREEEDARKISTSENQKSNSELVSFLVAKGINESGALEFEERLLSVGKSGYSNEECYEAIVESLQAFADGRCDRPYLWAVGRLDIIRQRKSVPAPKRSASRQQACKDVVPDWFKQRKQTQSSTSINVDLAEVDRLLEERLRRG